MPESDAHRFFVLYRSTQRFFRRSGSLIILPLGPPKSPVLFFCKTSSAAASARAFSLRVQFLVQLANSFAVGLLFSFQPPVLFSVPVVCTFTGCTPSLDLFGEYPLFPAVLGQLVFIKCCRFKHCGEFVPVMTSLPARYRYPEATALFHALVCAN